MTESRPQKKSHKAERIDLSYNPNTFSTTIKYFRNQILFQLSTQKHLGLTQKQFKMFRREVYTFFEKNIENVHDNNTRKIFISRLRELVSTYPARITTAIHNNFGREKVSNRADISVLSPLFNTIEQLDQYLIPHIHYLEKNHDTRTFQSISKNAQSTFLELESSAFDQLLTIIFNILNSEQLYLKNVTHSSVQRVKTDMVDFTDFLRAALTKQGEVIDVIELEREITKRITSIFSSNREQNRIDVKKYNIINVIEILESILYFMLRIKEKSIVLNLKMFSRNLAKMKTKTLSHTKK
jgi:hypothetical protein